MSHRFEDGGAYERFMGVWSSLAGKIFLDWLDPPKGLRWVDVGCGNGAFTELIVQRCGPASVEGIDPSDGQLAFARTRPGAAGASFRQGDAQALPFGDASFDAATMALVIFFVPDPAKGVAEMARVVRPGGLVATYGWDLAGGGFPLRFLVEELAAAGAPWPPPPSIGAEQFDSLRSLWASAGLEGVETRTIEVRRDFPDFDVYLDNMLSAATLRAPFESLPPEARDAVRRRVRERVADSSGRVSHGALANAIRGRVPAR